MFILLFLSLLCHCFNVMICMYVCCILLFNIYSILNIKILAVFTACVEFVSGCNMHGIIYRHIGRTELEWIDGQKSPAFRRGKSGNSTAPTSTWCFPGNVHHLSLWFYKLVMLVYWLFRHVICISTEHLTDFMFLKVLLFH